MPATGSPATARAVGVSTAAARAVGVSGVAARDAGVSGVAGSGAGVSGVAARAVGVSGVAGSGVAARVVGVSGVAGSGVAARAVGVSPAAARAVGVSGCAGGVRFDVVGVGNAIVDVIAAVPESFVREHGLAKGSMTLVDEQRSGRLLSAMPAGAEVSGGSAANTVAGVASFGGRASFIGKVRDDRLGGAFTRDIRAAGVSFDMVPAPWGPPTARCLIQVTPDAERTMNTFLGVSALLEPADIDPGQVASAAVTYCEGYLWDADTAKEAIRTAMDAARDAGRTVALALSDHRCVERHRVEWLDLIEDRVDVVFGNEAEVCALHCTDDLDAARRLTAKLAPTVAVTRGERGSVVESPAGVEEVPAAPVPEVVDATGAGDLYASGFLWGLCRGVPPSHCARLGALAAAEVISHVGARPLTPLSTLSP